MPVSFKNAVKKLIHAHVVDEAPANERQKLDVRIKATEIECVPIGQLKPNPRVKMIEAIAAILGLFSASVFLAHAVDAYRTL